MKDLQPSLNKGTAFFCALMALQTNNNSQPPEQHFKTIENRNFLSPVGFKFSIDRMRGVDFFCQAAAIPSISMNSADTGTRFNKNRNPGDELYYEDLYIKFLVDENMKNWIQVHDWMREIATPYSDREFKFQRGTRLSQHKRTGKYADLQNATSDNQWRCDCSLFILSSNYRPVAEFIFRDAWPVNLTTIQFDAGVPDVNYFTAEAVLRYNYYDHFIYEAAEATDSSMTPNYRVSQEGVELP